MYKIESARSQPAQNILYMFQQQTKWKLRFQLNRAKQTIFDEQRSRADYLPFIWCCPLFGHYHHAPMLTRREGAISSLHSLHSSVTSGEFSWVGGLFQQCRSHLLRLPSSAHGTLPLVHKKFFRPN